MSAAGSLMTATRRPEQLWLALGALALLLALAAAALWVAGVHQRAAARLAELEPRHARLAGLLQNGERLGQAQQALQANLAQYIYPPEADAAQLGNTVLQRVRELAGQQGLRVTSSQAAAPREDKDNPGFGRVGVSLRLEGEWPQLQGLLRALPAERPVIYSDTVQLLSQGAQAGRAPVIVQAQLELFVLQERKP